MTKKKILFVQDASFLNTGYGNYAKNVISRLHKTDKYEIAELGNYGLISDPRNRNIPWKWYANAPERGSPQEATYKANKIAEFGAMRLDRVCLDFLPDIVVCILDEYMAQYQLISPLRPFFHLSHMATIDSAPIKTQFLFNYTKVDSLLTYSKYGQKTVKESGHHNINLCAAAGGGIDPEIFKPILNKSAHRHNMGIDENALILGFVSRNQPRKLFPEFFHGFRLFLNECKAQNLNDLAERSYCLIHTSWPDHNAWNLPDLILEHGLSGKVLCTYVCKACKRHFVSFFEDGITACKKCGEVAALMPNVSFGCTQQQQNDIYNLMDAYFHCANCEGFGLTMPEAASCGVHCFVIDYSAMEDMKETINATPIKVERFYRDVNNTQYRALPDLNDFVQKYLKFIRQPAQIRASKGFQARQGAIKWYNWDRVAKIWEDHFDSIKLTGLQGKWDSPPRQFHPQVDNIPNHLPKKEFLEWCLVHILGQPEEIHSYFGSSLLRELNLGYTPIEGGQKQFLKEDLVKRLLTMRNNINSVEYGRCNRETLQVQDYIAYANQRELNKQKENI